MNVAFRTDASLDIGSGHVVRCLTLAGALHEQGGQCHFICREHPGNLIDRIRTSGFTVTALPMTARLQHVSVGEQIGPLPPHADWLGSDWHTDADATAAALRSCRPDWLVVDHYALARDWERQVRPHCKRLMVIDDLADRPHDCDLLLDQNLGREAADYADLVPETCTVLAGTRYALLRREFAALREYSLRRRNRPQLRRLLITMGGVDRSNATGQVLDALRSSPLPRDCCVTVVMGQHAPWLEDVRARAADLSWPCEVKVDVNNMAELMADSDLAIGAAGSTSWERCCLGVGTLTMIAARNQACVARELEECGAAIPIDDRSLATSLAMALNTIVTDDGLLQRLSKRAADLCDGEGSQRVVRHLLLH